jgi:hypothetical protein
MTVISATTPPGTPRAEGGHEGVASQTWRAGDYPPGGTAATTAVMVVPSSTNVQLIVAGSPLAQRLTVNW